MRALFGATSFSMYSAVVCAIILCSSVKSSGEKTRPGVVSVIRKLPPLKIVFCVATITQSFRSYGWIATEPQRHRDKETRGFLLLVSPSLVSLSLCLCVSVANSLHLSVISSDFRKSPPRPFHPRRTL